MAKKKQQGFQLPEDVIAWINQQEYATGANLSRIALAAFCCYLMIPESDRAQYMRAAVWLEKEECEFLDVPRVFIEHSIETATRLAAVAPTEKDRKALQASVDRWKKMLAYYKDHKALPAHWSRD